MPGSPSSRPGQDRAARRAGHPALHHAESGEARTHAARHAQPHAGQPLGCPSTSGSTSASTAGVEHQSPPGPAPRPGRTRPRRAAARPTASSTRPTGTLTQEDRPPGAAEQVGGDQQAAEHLAERPSRPTITAAYKLIARAAGRRRCRCRWMRLRTCGIIVAAPTPWTNRSAISAPVVGGEAAAERGER